MTEGSSAPLRRAWPVTVPEVTWDQAPGTAPKGPWPVLLIVEDEPDLLEAIGTALEEAFPKALIYGTTDAEEALDVLDQRRVDLVLADHRLPGMKGLELLERVRGDHPRTVRVLMTAFADVDLMVEAINEGHVDKLFRKPFRPAELIADLRELLDAPDPEAPDRRSVPTGQPA